jgi:hypothetical protein
MLNLITPVPRATDAEAGATRRTDHHGHDAWKILSWLGATFAILGLADIALGWYPAAFGNTEWEFGTISGSLNALTIPMMGLYLLVASAAARDDRRSGRALSILLWLLAAGLVGLGLVYVTVIPIAIKAVAGNELVLLGMKKAIVKGLTLLAGYGLLLVVGARRAGRIGERNG